MDNTIDKIVETALSKLRIMADTETIVGKPIETENGLVIPISKVTLGFVAGGGEYSEVTLAGKKPDSKEYPFAGGSGAGISVSPIAFVSVHNGETEVFSVDQKGPAQKILEMLPEVVKTALEKYGLTKSEKDISSKAEMTEK